MLTLHLAVLVALYLTAPYGKFVHFVYRLGALVLNSAELRQEAASRRQ
jgi:citrate/tricarballylate utilization protein